MMKLQTTTMAGCLSLLLCGPVFGQAQKEVCHLPSATKASTRPAQLMEGYGKVHMPITTRSAEAQKFFDQGLALLHSFWFYEADRSFERAAQLDPDCAMAQWGIAMADLNEGRRNAALARAKELAAKAGDRERLYLEAVEARYKGEKTTVQNNGFLGASEPYQRVLRKIVSFHPDDLEAKLFLALALMSGYERDGTPRPGTMESIALLQVVLSRAPNHLAAHHYMIHATEAGKRAIDGAPAADVYGTLAPKVGHAVHMPGHTYVHVNRWDDAARAFEGSAEVDRAYLRENNETSDHAAGPYGHNVHFLVMVYNYQGRYRDSIRASQEILDVGAKPGEATSRTALEARLARLRTLVRFEKWDEILAGPSLPDAGAFDIFAGWRYYALSLAHLNKGNLDAARAQLDLLEREAAWLKEKFGTAKNLPQIGRQKQQLRALAVAPFELRARLLAREGKAAEALAKLREAIEEEYKLGYSEPPIYPNPMEEVAGKLALELKQWADAEGFFRAALERDPGSGRAWLGLMQAQQALGKTDEARQSLAQFRQAWTRADADLPETLRARESAAGSSSGNR
ncbi:MAG: tetratricopeptide repeat protein [Blastocatellia bacterium]|nr:tetratricopeptide repeat protein [Blastocatellia bacterium]